MFIICINYEPSPLISLLVLAIGVNHCINTDKNKKVIIHGDFNHKHKNVNYQVELSGSHDIPIPM